MTRPTLNEKLAAGEPRMAPEPETAEERHERLLSKRSWAAVLGVIALIAWGVIEVLGHLHQFGRWGFVVIVAGVLWAIFSTDDEDGDDD